MPSPKHYAYLESRKCHFTITPSSMFCISVSWADMTGEYFRKYRMRLSVWTAPLHFLLADKLAVQAVTRETVSLIIVSFQRPRTILASGVIDDSGARLLRRPGPSNEANIHFSFIGPSSFHWLYWYQASARLHEFIWALAGVVRWDRIDARWQADSGFLAQPNKLLLLSLITASLPHRAILA